MSREERHADEIRRVEADGTEYDCQAYGPGSQGLCFMQNLAACDSREMCERTMKQERMLLYVRLMALAAMGDDTAKWMLGTINGPHELLNGDQVEPEADQT